MSDIRAAECVATDVPTFFANLTEVGGHHVGTAVLPRRRWVESE